MADRVRRFEALDWIVVAVLLPLAAAYVAAFVWYGMETGAQRITFRIARSSSAADCPIVSVVAPDARFEGPALRVGDRVLRAGDEDLRGAASIELWVAGASALFGSSLLVERGGTQFSTIPVTSPPPGWWAALPVSLWLLTSALILLLRARHWRLARRASLC